MATLKRNQSTVPKIGRSHKSKLLTREENFMIHSLIDKNGVSLVTTVAELYLTEPPLHNNWIKEGTGVLCLVQNLKNEYSFHLYSLEREDIMWWCPLGKNSTYRSEMSFFHMFSAQNCVVGFNFANDDEAKIIREVVRNYQKTTIDSKFIVEKPRRTPTLPRKGKKKSDVFISRPTDFQHIAHVSFDQKSFNNNTKNQLLSDIFQMAGITESQMKDEKTMKFMVKFVQKKQSRKKHRAPPPPLPSTQLSASRLGQEPTLKRMPSRPPPAPPVQRQYSFGNKSLATTPPPPPPPLPVIQTEIHGEEMVSSFITPEPSVPDNRSALLESIRKGGTLRPVKKREIRPVDDEELFKNDIATALSKAIRLREKALQNNDSFSESDGDSDEWGDST